MPPRVPKKPGGGRPPKQRPAVSRYPGGRGDGRGADRPAEASRDRGPARPHHDRDRTERPGGGDRGRPFDRVPAGRDGRDGGRPLDRGGGPSWGGRAPDRRDDRAPPRDGGRRDAPEPSRGPSRGPDRRDDRAPDRRYGGGRPDDGPPRRYGPPRGDRSPRDDRRGPPGDGGRGRAWGDRDRPPRPQDEGYPDRRPAPRPHEEAPRFGFTGPGLDRDHDRERAEEAPRPPRLISRSDEAERARRARPGETDPYRLHPDLVVGVHAVETLLVHSPQRVREVYIWDADARAEARILQAASAARVRVLTEAPAALDEVGDHAQGVALRVTTYPYADLDDLVPASGAAPQALLLALDGVTDPRNLGAILRAAAFFGASGVLIPQDRSAEMSPLVERIAAGGSAVVPVARVVNLARGLAALRERGVTVVGTVAEKSAADLRAEALSRPLCIVLGGEGSGIRPIIRKNCDILATWPAPTAMPSLNVASFATLALSIVGPVEAEGALATENDDA